MVNYEEDLTREVLLRERLSTVDLQVLNSLDQLLFILKNLFTFFYKTSYFNEEVNCTEPSPKLAFPDLTLPSKYIQHPRQPVL